jgi:hypothetical protein
VSEPGTAGSSIWLHQVGNGTMDQTNTRGSILRADAVRTSDDGSLTRSRRYVKKEVGYEKDGGFLWMFPVPMALLP